MMGNATHTYQSSTTDVVQDVSIAAAICLGFWLLARLHTTPALKPLLRRQYPSLAKCARKIASVWRYWTVLGMHIATIVLATLAQPSWLERQAQFLLLSQGARCALPVALMSTSALVLRGTKIDVVTVFGTTRLHRLSIVHRGLDMLSVLLSLADKAPYIPRKPTVHMTKEIPRLGYQLSILTKDPEVWRPFRQ
jgi:hypothetical protein